MAKSYKHVKPIAQDDKHGCWSASMAWWTKAVPTVEDYTDDEVKVEFSHLMGANGGLRFPEGFRQMLADPRWGMTVEVTNSSSTALELAKEGLKKAPVMFGFCDRRVGGHHAVVLHDYSSSILAPSQITFMDPNGGVHTTTLSFYVMTPGFSVIVGYLK